MLDFQCDNLFSLEDEESSQLFITQTPCGSQIVDNKPGESSEKLMEFKIKGADFQSPRVSLVSKLPEYSDISDDDFNIPVSQKRSPSKNYGKPDETTFNKTSIEHGIARVSGFNSRTQLNTKLGFAAKKAVTKVRMFKSISDEKMKLLKQNRLKRRTFAKVQWAVTAYCEWRNSVLSDPCRYDFRIYESDLKNVSKLQKDSVEFVLCKFIAEVTKVKDGSDYPGRTLYQMIVAIQKHLNHNGIDWKLVEGSDFTELRTVLDNVMKERASNNVGLVRKQAEYISFEYEEKLWNENILGEDTPDKLRNTVLFLLGMNLALRAGDEHYDLRRNCDAKLSQLSFKKNSEGVKCLVYTEDTVTKTNNGGLTSMRKERKVVWVYPSKNVVRDPVRLVEKYISLCPPVTVKTKKLNFYLHSLEKPTFTQWYGEQVMGLNSIRKVVGNLKSANLNGHFTNHSLRRTRTSRLFQSGVDKKLIKEFTGHVQMH